MMKKLLKKLLIACGLYKPVVLHKQFIQAQTMIAAAENMVDIGCGVSPHPKAKVAVDKFIEPEHRSYGKGKSIDVTALTNENVRFVLADIANMPFSDKEFDVAHSHHVLEHVDDPISACKEIQRIAKSGVIFTPSAFSEIAFGRPYHKWLMHAKGNTLIFIEKNHDENQPFSQERGGGNPFDIALNDGYWYKFPIIIKNLRKKLRAYWYGHHPVIEVIFCFEDTFSVVVIHNDGSIRTLNIDTLTFDSCQRSQ